MPSALSRRPDLPELEHLHEEHHGWGYGRGKPVRSSAKGGEEGYGASFWSVYRAVPHIVAWLTDVVLSGHDKLYDRVCYHPQYGGIGAVQEGKRATWQRSGYTVITRACSSSLYLNGNPGKKRSRGLKHR